MIKITRKTLLIVIAALGVFIIVYSIIRQFTGLGLDAAGEKRMMDIIIFAALGLFVYNRKLAGDEKREREAREEAERRAAEEPEEEKSQKTDSADDESLPHWERNKEKDHDA